LHPGAIPKNAEAKQSTSRSTKRFFISPNFPTYLVALDDALNRLAKKYARKLQVVELRFYGGIVRGRNGGI